MIEDEAPLTAERRQAIATELGYSETVFFQDVKRRRCVSSRPPLSCRWRAIRWSAPRGSWRNAWGVSTQTLRPALAAEVATWTEDGATWIRARVADAPPFEYVELESEAAVRAVQPGPEWGQHYIWAWTDRAADKVYARCWRRRSVCRRTRRRAARRWCWRLAWAGRLRSCRRRVVC